MKRKDLTKEIREYLHYNNNMPYHVVKSMDDINVLKCLTHCPCCGEPKFSENQIKNAISISEDLETFTEILENTEITKLHAN
jgi:hypothetical protein